MPGGAGARIGAEAVLRGAQAVPVRGDLRLGRRARGEGLGGLLLGAGAAAIAAYQARPLAIVVAGARMRISPHGRAPEVTAVETGTAVRPSRRDGGWVLVQGPGARAGWLPVAALATVSE
jgi:hypothetical protein